MTISPLLQPWLRGFFCLFVLFVFCFFVFLSSFVVVIIMRIFADRLFVPELSLVLKVSVCLGLKIKVYFLSNGCVDISVIYL